VLIYFPGNLLLNHFHSISLMSIRDDTQSYCSFSNLEDQGYR